MDNYITGIGQSHLLDLRVRWKPPLVHRIDSGKVQLILKPLIRKIL